MARKRLRVESGDGKEVPRVREALPSASCRNPRAGPDHPGAPVRRVLKQCGVFRGVFLTFKWHHELCTLASPPSASRGASIPEESRSPRRFCSRPSRIPPRGGLPPIHSPSRTLGSSSFLAAAPNAARFRSSNSSGAHVPAWLDVLSPEVLLLLRGLRLPWSVRTALQSGCPHLSHQPPRHRLSHVSYRGHYSCMTPTWAA